jgi:hypothetical protein
MTKTTDQSMPYRDEAINVIYSLLFSDDLSLIHIAPDAANAYPWSILLSSETGEQSLHTLASDTSLESRARLLAYHRIRQAGHQVDEKELLGVIVEVGLDEGLDVLASYQDGTARYINYTGRMIIWESPDEASRAITNQLFHDSMNIVRRIGPWSGARRPHPAKGVVRISFLVSDGLYFGEGPINVLFNDALAAPALSAATALMQYLAGRGN